MKKFLLFLTVCVSVLLISIPVFAASTDELTIYGGLAQEVQYEKPYTFYRNGMLAESNEIVTVPLKGSYDYILSFVPSGFTVFYTANGGVIQVIPPHSNENNEFVYGQYYIGRKLVEVCADQSVLIHEFFHGIYDMTRHSWTAEMEQQFADAVALFPEIEDQLNRYGYTDPSVFETERFARLMEIYYTQYAQFPWRLQPESTMYQYYIDHDEPKRMAAVEKFINSLVNLCNTAIKNSGGPGTI